MIVICGHCKNYWSKGKHGFNMTDNILICEDKKWLLEMKAKDMNGL